MGHLYHGYVTNNQRVFTLNGKCGTWKSSDFPWFSHLSTSISLRNFTLFMFDDTGSGNASWKPGILSRRLPGLSFSVKNPRLDVHPSYLLLFWFKQKYTEYRAYMTNTIIYLDIYDPYIYIVTNNYFERILEKKKNVCSLELEGRSWCHI